MALVIAERKIRRVVIVDDDQSVRRAYQFSVEELGIAPVLEDGPLPGQLNDYVTAATRKADAAICDHHLRVKNYSGFNGAELVAGLYQAGFPAILCTKWEEAHIDDLRRYRRYIPVLLKPDQLTPATITQALTVCIQELSGTLLPSRRLWRAVIRIEDVDPPNARDRFVFVVIPSWNHNEVVRLRLADVRPEIMGKFAPGARLHALVNLSASSQEQLFFENWEPA